MRIRLSELLQADSKTSIQNDKQSRNQTVILANIGKAPQEIENNFENNNSISDSTTEMNTQNKAYEDDEKPAEKDFSVYDNFAAFEVNDGKPVSFNEDNGELIGDEPDLMLKKSDYIDTHNSENQNEQSSENLSNETHGELTEKKPKDYLIEVTPIESEQLSNQNINLNNNIASNNEDKVEYDFSGGEDNDDEVETISDEEFMKLLNGEDIEGLDDEKTDEEKKENIVTQNSDTQANKIENNEIQSDNKTEGSNEDNLDELLKQGKLGELLIDNQENDNQEIENTISEDKVESEEVNQNKPQITENDEENKPFTTDKNEENQTEPNTSFFRRRKPDYESTINYREVNQANFSSLGLTAEELFEPCTNLKASAQILSKCYARMSKKGLGEAQALSDALSCYYSGNDVTGYKHGYVHRVTQNSINKTAVKVPSISLLTDSPPLSSQISSSAKSTEKASAQDDPLLRASQAKQAKGEQVQDKLIF